MTLLGFKRNELVVVSLIIFGIMIATFANLQVSFRRARDVQRRGDLRAIQDALLNYQIDVASYPASDNGYINACDGWCEWGWDGLGYKFETEAKPRNYLKTIPTDPHHARGARYLYLSNGRHFQIFASLEGFDEAEFNPEIVARNLKCGERVCNFGLADYDTPLEISIEEYENELRRLNNE